MSLINFSTLFTNHINSTASIGQIGFKGSTSGAFQGSSVEFTDGFTSNPVYTNFKSKAEIEQLAKSNPRIAQLCSEYGIPIKANMEELNALRNGHLKDTRILAAKIASNLG